MPGSPGTAKKFGSPWKTSHFSLAEAKLAELPKEHREFKAKTVDPRAALMKFSAADVKDDVAFKNSIARFPAGISTALPPVTATASNRTAKQSSAPRWMPRFFKYSPTWGDHAFRRLSPVIRPSPINPKAIDEGSGTT